MDLNDLSLSADLGSLADGFGIDDVLSGLNDDDASQQTGLDELAASPAGVFHDLSSAALHSTAITPSPAPESPASHQAASSAKGKRKASKDDESKPKRARRAKASTEHLDEEKIKNLERNRAAATRCREKKKQAMVELERRAQTLTVENQQKQEELERIKQEVLQLKMIVLAKKGPEALVAAGISLDDPTEDVLHNDPSVASSATTGADKDSASAASSKASTLAHASSQR